MYALKFVSNKHVHSYLLGSEYHVQRLDPKCDSEPLAMIHGESQAKGWEVYYQSDAYITTLEGKTVEVVHRIAWPQ